MFVNALTDTMGITVNTHMTAHRCVIARETEFAFQTENVNAIHLRAEMIARSQCAIILFSFPNSHTFFIFFFERYVVTFP